MTGLEYILLHVQEPILYVIRKQHRHSPTAVSPIADYYIIAGVVYQAPDLGSVVSSRLVSESRCTFEVLTRLSIVVGMFSTLFLIQYVFDITTFRLL